MQLTTVEQLVKVKVGEKLFLINPFGNKNQSKVEIETFTVGQLCDGFFKGRVQYLNLGIDYMSKNYIGDMLSRCKYVFTDLSEANAKLKDVRGGIHADTVGEHHDWCDEIEKDFDIYA